MWIELPYCCYTVNDIFLLKGYDEQTCCGNQERITIKRQLEMVRNSD